MASAGGSDRLDPVEAVGELGRIVLADSPLDRVLERVAQVAKALLGATGVSVSLIRAGSPSTVASTDPATTALDESQYSVGDGPCMEAARTGIAVYVPDLREETRWPAIASRAEKAGVRSVLATPLPVDADTGAALNVYCVRPGAFDDEDERILAMSFAAHASAAVANAHAYDLARAAAAQLQEAMRSRASIEQAKGVVMARRGIDADEAFGVLVASSQRLNRKLRELAAELVSDPAAYDRIVGGD